MRHWDRTRQDGPLTVQVEHAGDALTVRAVGELSRSTAETFEAELRLVISGDASTVDLDLGAVALSTPRACDPCCGSVTSRFGPEAGFGCGHVSAPVQEALAGGGLERLLPSVD